MNKNQLKEFAVEVMIKPLPKVLAECALVYEATVVGTVAIGGLILAIISKFKKD